MAEILAPLDEIARRSEHLFRKPIGPDGTEVLPRYLYLGPRGGGDYFRLGIFATIHGDEPEGGLGMVRVVERLESERELGRGYALFLYPVCNPTGLAARTRHSRSGKDLNREFWTGSMEPEVRWLETEIWTHAFHGIITLHSDDTSDGVYGFVNGQVLSENLLEPALKAAERHLPLNHQPRIDGFPARRGIIYEGYDGMLRSVPDLHPSPFEITFETPGRAPRSGQVEAVSTALATILSEFRRLMSFGQGI
jgi:predicted deacylase